MNNIILVIAVNILVIYLIKRGVAWVKYMDRLDSLPDRDTQGRFTSDVRYEQNESPDRLIKVKYYDEVYYV